VYFHSTYGRALGKDEIFQSRHDGLPAGNLHSMAGYVGIGIYRSSRRSIEKLIGLKIVSEQIESYLL
jgi:hypothetical protein